MHCNTTDFLYVPIKKKYLSTSVKSLTQVCVDSHTHTGKQNANICIKFYFCSVEAVCIYPENSHNVLLERLSLSICCYKTQCVFNRVKRKEILPILNTIMNGEPA